MDWGPRAILFWVRIWMKGAKGTAASNKRARGAAVVVECEASAV